MAFRQIASSAAGTRAEPWHGRGKSPFRTLRNAAATSFSVTDGWPVSSAYRVAPRLYTSLIKPTGCLFWTHVSRCSHLASHLGWFSSTSRCGPKHWFVDVGMIVCVSYSFGESPIHDTRLAIFSQHHVARLQVSVQHAATVSVLDGITDIDESSEQLAQLQIPLARGPTWITGLVKIFNGLS